MRAVVGCPDPGSEKRQSIAYVRPQAILPTLAFAGLASDLPDPRPGLLSGQQLHGRAENVLSTVSPGSTRPGFGLIQRDNSRVGHWNSSTSMVKFLFQKP